MNTKRFFDATRGFGVGTIGGLLAAVVLYAVILASSAIFGCKPTGSETPGGGADDSGFGIEKLNVEGQCDAKITLHVKTPLFTIPIDGSVNTKVAGKRTFGGAILKLMGGMSENVCDVDTDKNPKFHCKAILLGREVLETTSKPPTSNTTDHPASPPTSAPYYDPTDPI